MLKFLLASAFVFTAVSPFASASVPVTTRYDWVYEDGAGYFHADQGGGGSWTETINGAPTYHFTQVARNDAYVEIYDASRQIHVWLYPAAFYMQGPGDSQPHQVRTGHWDDRRFYTYRLTDGLYYFNLYPGKMWRFARPSGYLSNAIETLRNNEQIQVYDAAAHTTFSFLDHEVWAKVDGNNWFKLADGGWN